MKPLIMLLCAVLLLTGCASDGVQLQNAMTLRAQLQQQEAAFDALITADYGDKTHSFTVSCAAHTDGSLAFTVQAPDAIAGISGTVSATGAALKFDQQALAFPVLADGQVTPVCGPWILINTLRSGYLTSSGREGEYLRLAIDDSYQDDALHLDIWLDENNLPARGEILWQGRRVLSIAVTNFRFL